MYPTTNRDIVRCCKLKWSKSLSGNLLVNNGTYDGHTQRDLLGQLFNCLPCDKIVSGSFSLIWYYLFQFVTLTVLVVSFLVYRIFFILLLKRLEDFFKILCNRSSAFSSALLAQELSSFLIGWYLNCRFFFNLFVTFHSECFVSSCGIRALKHSIDGFIFYFLQLKNFSWLHKKVNFFLFFSVRVFLNYSRGTFVE